MDEKKLKPRQRKFAELYVESGNAMQSAIQAGYSERYAQGNSYKLVENSGIKKYIDELTEKAQDAKIATVKDRKVILSEIAKNTGEKANNRIKAIDTLNKMDGLYIVTDENDIVPTTVNFNIIPATPELAEDEE